MNANLLISKLIGAVGAAVTGIAFVSLFTAMGASGAALALAEAAQAAMPIVKAERIEVVGKAERSYAINTRGVKKSAL